uniref:Spermatogenesis associated 7 n=1 Tax=Labrus bergylta TaxID=56723 RepID=A0A3Q3NQG8_9LABR
LTFCPQSSSKLTQSIIKDHMLSHYKKVYSAKAAVDASVPKSLIHSSRLSAQYDDSPYLCSRSSMVSSPRFNTSFNAKDVVYPSNKLGPQHRHHHTRPASEMKYRSPEATLHRRQSACSLEASGEQSFYKTFQDPVQKTYSGDLLQKHSQHFTGDKPFTPKTLKSDKSSYLSKYRYYRAPRRKPAEDCNKSRFMRQETYHGRYLQKHVCLFELFQQQIQQVFSNKLTFIICNAYTVFFIDIVENHTGMYGFDYIVLIYLFNREEELTYLEFISAVTEDILSRAHISDRILDRVMKRHIDMNRHYLDEGKMRHLLEVLRKEFEEPTDVSTLSAEIEKKENGLLDTLLPHLESETEEGKTKDNKNLFSYASLIRDCDLPQHAAPLLVSTPLCSPERTASPTKTNEMEEEKEDSEENFSSLWLGEHVPNHTGLSEEDVHQNQMDTTAANKEISNDSQVCTTVTKRFIVLSEMP